MRIDAVALEAVRPVDVPEQHRAVVVDQVEGGVHDARPGTAVELGDRALQQRRVQHVVVAENHPEVRLDVREEPVLVPEQPEVLRLPDVLDPRVVERGDDLRRLVLGGVVGDEQPEVVERLLEHAADRVGKELRAVVGRDEDGDARHARIVHAAVR
jgi:hypothetical protein